MGHSTSSGRSGGGAAQTASVTPERRAALDSNRQARSIQNMTFREYRDGSRAEVPGVGTATVTYNDVTERYEGGFSFENGQSMRLSGSSETLRQMEERVRTAMYNRWQRGDAGYQRDVERQERIIRANNRILGRSMSDEEVARRATRGAEANAANRRRRRG